MYAKKANLGRWWFGVWCLWAVVAQAEVCGSGTGPAQGGAKLKVANVSVIEEYSDQSNQKGSRVFVVKFDRKVRNRGGFLVIPVADEKPLRVPVRSTVAEAYDAATSQLEVREWEAHSVDDEESPVVEWVGKSVTLELESCPTEYMGTVRKVIETKFLDPDYQQPDHKFEQMILGLDVKLPLKRNGGVRAVIEEKGKLKYVWFFLYPNRKAADQIFLSNQLLELGLTPEVLSKALVGRRVGIEVSGSPPWVPLASPFPVE